MEQLDPNLIMQMALDLDLPSIVQLCRTSQKFNDTICKSPTFWMNKLRKDYPKFADKFPKNVNYKKVYEYMPQLIKMDRFSFNMIINNLLE